MGYTIALGGKGGTGKTTIAGLLMRYMLKHNMKPILAIDADSNSNLNEVLGVPLEATLSDARETMKTSVPVGMTKDIFMEMKMEESLVESHGFDLIAMGRPEGPGCYCAANNLLSSLIERLMKNYAYLVVDNEAGMEHFSRLTQKDVDLLLLVSDPTPARACGGLPHCRAGAQPSHAGGETGPGGQSGDGAAPALARGGFAVFR